jgi:glutamate---cysteine ligase / carboxylate-amine ligase
MRTIGVEEELLLVDAKSGHPLAVAERVLRRAESIDDTQQEPGRDTQDDPGSRIEPELQQQQVETDTHPHTDLTALADDLRSWRNKTIAAANEEGARVLAAGTSPVPARPTPIRDPRNARLVERFGLTTAEQLTCGCHVHVSVDSDAEAVAVLDRIRVWLPALLAISGNSPYWQGSDSRYASYRSQVIARWPSAGPTDLFGSADAYQTLVSRMVGSGVLLDEGMVYFDARLSQTYPTVEVRVADVCLDMRDAVLVAALCRGLVETSANQWSAGEQSPPVPSAMLRLATWQAAREGMDGHLLDPLTCRPRPARHVVLDLIEHVRPALRSAGDETLVAERFDQLLARGNGAKRQRNLVAAKDDLERVVSELVEITAGDSE